MQKLLSLIRFHLFLVYLFACFAFVFYFTFAFFTLGDRSKKIVLQFLLKNILPMFSSENFMISNLAFRSLIHFKLISIYGVIKCFNFIVLHIAIQFSLYHLLKRLFFPHCMFLSPLS